MLDWMEEKEKGFFLPLFLVLKGEPRLLIHEVGSLPFCLGKRLFSVLVRKVFPF